MIIERAVKLMCMVYYASIGTNALRCRRETQNYLCHCWVDDRILVATDTGDVVQLVEVG